MKKSNNLLKVIITLVVVAVLGFAVYSMNSGAKSTAAGSITVEVKDLGDKMISDKTVEYQEGETLVQIVQNNFDNVTIDNGMLMTIESLTTPEDWSTFISILVDGEFSQVGIEEIEVKDGMTVTFENVEFSYDE